MRDNKTGFQNLLSPFSVFIVLMASTIASVAAQSGPSGGRAVTVTDCVCIRRIVEGPIIAPDGRLFAYVLKTPNIKSDKNEYEVRVRSSEATKTPYDGRVVMRATQRISGIKWLNDNVHLAAVVDENHVMRMKGKISISNTTSGTTRDIKIPSGISEWSISNDGNTIAYSTAVALRAEDRMFSDPVAASHGFHISSDYYLRMTEEKGAILPLRKEVWIARRATPDSAWTAKQVAPPPDALPSEGDRRGFTRVRAMSVSPNGKYIVLAYELESHLDAWEANRTVKAYRDADAANPFRLALYDVAANAFRSIPEIPFPNDPVWWSDDSREFATISAAPIGSRWETTDAIASADPTGPASYHLFAVEVETEAVSEVLNAKDTPGVSLVSWKTVKGGMILNIGRGRRTVQMNRAGDQWVETRGSRTTDGFALSPNATGDGRHFVGVHQDAKLPPDIWFLDRLNPSAPIRLTRLNPQTAGLRFGDIKTISWTNKYGFLLSGQLLTPADADRTRKLPLIIMLTWPNELFGCDGHYGTAFPPASLVDAGFAVAIFNVYNAFRSDSSQPEGPPLIKEAESMVASIEALVDYLANTGVASKDDVGIIGFSRSSWKVDYLITHSTVRLRAASSADSGVGNYGGTWINGYWPGVDQENAGYGGSFFKARSAWLNGAPAFNADKVNAPLLMEYTGNGGLVDQPLDALEFYSALMTLKKPVELFFYPKGLHPLDAPFERIASLQRNVDWFTFWMQGKEGNPPNYDKTQFLRWRGLRHLEETPEFNGVNAKVTSRLP